MIIVTFSSSPFSYIVSFYHLFLQFLGDYMSLSPVCSVCKFLYETTLIESEILVCRTGEYASTAYVTFRDPHALETAVLLSVSSAFSS